MYGLCKDYEEQDHKNNKNMEWLDSYFNLERMLRSLKTLIDDLKKKRAILPMLVFGAKNMNIHLTVLVITFIALLGKQIF